MFSKFKNIKFVAILLLCAFVSLKWVNSYADSDVFYHFQMSNEDSSQTIDHEIWDDLLAEYIEPVDGVNMFRYGEVDDEDLDLLNRYLVGITNVEVTALNSFEQFAYWLNLYNALTVKVILDHYPVDSIRNITFGLFSKGPWKEKLITVEQINLSLDDIEHVILRPIYEDPRIHYAVNCASIGCPNLQPFAYTTKNLEDALELAATEYINHPRGVSIVDDELIVSSIFDWYADDFGEDEEEVIDHLTDYAKEPLLSQLYEFDDIDSYHYDWSLNEQRRGQ